jgi:hypothetical protein
VHSAHVSKSCEQVAIVSEGLTVSPVSRQHPPQAGPAPSPGPTPYRFWDTAALKPGEV